MNKTKTYPTTSVADMHPSKRRGFIESRAKETAKAELALQEELRNIGQPTEEKTVPASNKREKLSLGTKVALGAAATAAVIGGLELADSAFDGRSETDDFKTHVENYPHQEYTKDNEGNWKPISVPSEAELNPPVENNPES